ncbi:hypothetical protein ACFL96_09855 [Thermoproteota archaeon]
MKDGQIIIIPPEMYIDNNKMEQFFQSIVNMGGCGIQASAKYVGIAKVSQKNY